MAKLGKRKSKKAKPVKQLTRKEQRKQRALQKKENKRLFFSKKLKVQQPKRPLVLAPQRIKAEKDIEAEHLGNSHLSDNDIDNEDESIASDFSDEEVDARLESSGLDKNSIKSKTHQQNLVSTKRAKVQPTRVGVEEQHRRELQKQRELEKSSRKQRIKQLHLQNEEEDVEIARLEKKLKLNRSKDKNRLVRKMFNDGLDYALDLCLDDEEERAKLELKERRKKAQQEADNEDDMHWSEESLSGDEGSEQDEEEGSNSGNDESGNDSESESAESNENENAHAGEDSELKFKEDIYGRKRDKDGNIIQEETTQKYIPPHLRAKLAASSDNIATTNGKQAELLERIRKQCKGLLNRLSEANLHKIATGIEGLYMRNSRFNMNETLIKLLNEALISKTMTKERMVQEHMVLLAYLHAQIGSEIGAHFLQSYVEKFSSYCNMDVYSMAIEDKRLNNVVLLLSYMYIFKIFEHRLLIEIIDKLAQYLCEKTIECLLVIFQSVGFKLRKDDPIAFKEMMNNVQQRIATAPLEMKENLRLKFMVETLNAVKNNNHKKIPQYDPELAENLRKRLKAMLRNDKYVTTLNITIDDLLRADQVGKWWIVGSAWTGNINDLGAAHKPQATADDDSTENELFSEKLLKLAKQQQMNTEERRRIFCIVMSAEDYIDAFEKIVRLALKDQRSIAYVIIHCCLNEAQWNPYYAHLALKFCNYNRKYQLAFQFAAWDRINDINALNKQQIKNLARFLQHLIINMGLHLSALKVVDFLQLEKSSFLLMREIIVAILLHPNENEIYPVFERVAKNPKVHQFKNSLRLFMQHFLLKQETSQLKLSDEELKILSKRVNYVDNLLAYVDL